MSNPLDDLELPDVLFCIGTNMTECHPVAATRLMRALDKGARLIVADPRHIRLAERAHLVLPLRVGTDVALLSAMAHVIVRDGLVNQEFIAQRTQGYEQLAEHLRPMTPQWAQQITGVRAADIEQAARWYAQAKDGAIYYTLGITEHQAGVDNVQSLCNLALLTGHIGRHGTGINPLRGQNNVQGAGDMGAVPTSFPGYQKVGDDAARARFEQAYGRKLPNVKGPTKVGAMELALEGKLKAMLIDGENTLQTDENRTLTEQALANLDHLVVIDIFPSETTKLAHVVLPASSWGETDGTCVNTERRVQRLRRAVAPQGEARPDWWIVCQIAQRLGFRGFDFAGPHEIFAEVAGLSPIYKGLTWERVDEAIQWPVPEAGHPGTEVLHEGTFINGRGLFQRVTFKEPPEVVNAHYPLWLTTGRRLQSYHSHTMTGRSAGIDKLLAGETLEMHPADLVTYGLRDGGRCRVTSPRGSLIMQVAATDRSPRGTVFTSFAFADTPVNVLTGSGHDPVTETSEMKVSIVRVEPVDGSG